MRLSHSPFFIFPAYGVALLIVLSACESSPDGTSWAGSSHQSLRGRQGSVQQSSRGGEHARRRWQRDARLDALASDARGFRRRHASHMRGHDTSDEESSPLDPGVDAGAPALLVDAGSGASEPDPVPSLYDAGLGTSIDAGLTGGEGSGEARPDAGGGTEPEPDPGRDIVARSALPIYALEGERRLSEEELWERIASSPAICFGEDHTSPFHHYAQTRGQAELAVRSAALGRSVAFGFEMFERRFQAPIDAFIRGESSEEQVLLDTQYLLRWGYDYALYRPLVEAARDLGATVLGLNARREIVRKIARTGLASLTAVEQAEMPELVLDDPEHRAFIFALFGVLPEHAAESGLENVYVAQTTWDETMADTSAAWLAAAAAPDSRIMLFAGFVHCHRSAIPRRITRRTGLPVLSLLPTLESQLPQVSGDGYDLRVVLVDVPDPGD